MGRIGPLSGLVLPGGPASRRWRDMGWLFETRAEREAREAREKAKANKAKRRQQDKQADRDAAADFVGRVVLGLWKAG